MGLLSMGEAGIEGEGFMGLGGEGVVRGGGGRSLSSSCSAYRADCDSLDASSTCDIALLA
jgi:hypothetical protein